MMSDHGMKPMYWVFHLNRWLEEHGHLRYRRRSLQRLRGTRLRALAGLDQRLARTRGAYTRVLDALPFVPRVAADRAFADIDFPRTRAYSFATGGQVYLGESSAAAGDPAFAERLARELEAQRHPETGEPLLRVLRKTDIYHGPYLDRAPDLIVLSIDERIHVDSLRLRGTAAIEVHSHLDPENAYGYSGHHGVDGILAAHGPGIRPGVVPAGSGIVQMAATILRLHGIEAGDVDGAPIEGILAAHGPGIRPGVVPAGSGIVQMAATILRLHGIEAGDVDGAPIEGILAGAGEAVRVAAQGAAASDEGVYSAEEEAGILERLRDLGYE
jgi:predicted AlkP superfamily phosphohydrolase/phosphomutase